MVGAGTRGLELVSVLPSREKMSVNFMQTFLEDHSSPFMLKRKASSDILKVVPLREPKGAEHPEPISDVLPKHE